jgi:hypothetical protein
MIATADYADGEHDHRMSTRQHGKRLPYSKTQIISWFLH